MLKLGRNKINEDIRTLMMIDSLDMADSNRKIILKNGKKTKEDKILITHEKDTVVEIAQVLG
ncbi:MAG: hypothetical protein O6849_07865 [Candidatus Dadabacteria bacterium]|nr:hypothetical protein [Candidatus Dadabacteria bacterium]